MSAEVRSYSGPVVDVQLVMRRIRKQIRGGDPEHEWVRQGRRAVPSHLISSVGRLRASTALLRGAIARIGDLPPAPPTLRGRIGGALVQIVRRALFWLIPSIQTAQGQIVDALEGQLAATEEILGILQQTHVELARLAWRDRLSITGNASPAKGSSENPSAC